MARLLALCSSGKEAVPGLVKPTDSILLILHGEVDSLETERPELVAQEEVGEVDLEIQVTQVLLTKRRDF